MANKKISALTALTGANAADTDVIPILDLSEADASKNKKISIAELKKQGTIYTTLAGDAWDGSFNTKTLTANTALTFSSTKRVGVLRIQQDGTGGRTLSINGTAITINSGGDGVTYITANFNDVTGEFDYIVDLNVYSISGGAGDTTPPVLVTAEISNAEPTKIRLTYDETLGASTPADTDFAVLKNGGALGLVSVAVAGTLVDLEFLTPAVSTDVYTFSYTPGTNPIEDVAGNNAASLSGQAVTNNVSAGYQAETTAWEAAITGAGGSITGTVKDAVDDLIVALKAASIFTTHFDGLYVLCGGSEAATKFNILDPQNLDASYRLTFNNSATFASTGVSANGSNQTISSHFIPGLAAKMSLNDLHVAVYHRTSAGVDNPAWGINQTGKVMYLFPKESSGNGAWVLPEGSGTITAPANAKGFWIARKNATNNTIHKDGSELINNILNGNGNTLSTDYDLVFNGWNNNGTPGLSHAAELSIISFGKYLDDTQRAAYETAVANLVTALSL